MRSPEILIRPLRALISAPYCHAKARTSRFDAAFDGLAERVRSFVIDGEIAAPDERGVTHLDDSATAIANRQPETRSRSVDSSRGSEGALARARRRAAERPTALVEAAPAT